MVNAEHDNGGLGSGVQGQSPWSGGQGSEAPLKLKAFFAFAQLEELVNLS